MAETITVGGTTYTLRETPKYLAPGETVESRLASVGLQIKKPGSGRAARNAEAATAARREAARQAAILQAQKEEASRRATRKAQVEEQARTGFTGKFKEFPVELSLIHI